MSPITFPSSSTVGEFIADWQPQPFAQASGFPAWTYHSDEFFQVERDRFFARTWLFVAHESDLPPQGETGWYSVSVAGFPVLLTRDAAGTVRAFHNVCPHRGAPLGAIGDPTVCSGRSKHISCPYHGWNFSLDGSLKGASGMDAHPCWNREQHHLRSLRLENWGPFWFVNLWTDAPPLTHQLGPAVERFAGAQLSQWVRVHRVDYRTESNWKFYVENNAEYYHEPTAHGSSYQLKAVSWNNNYHAVRPEVSEYCYLQHSPYPADAPEMTGKLAKNTVMPGLDRTWLEASSIFQCWPNFAWILNPNVLVLYLVDPISPTQTRIRWDWLVPDTPEARDPANLAPLISLYDRVQKEDLAIFEMQQRAVRSPVFTMGQLNPKSEIGLHRFQHLLMEHLTRHH